MSAALHVHSSFIGMRTARARTSKAIGTHISFKRAHYIGIGLDHGTSVLRRATSKRLSSPRLDVFNADTVASNRVSTSLQNHTSQHIVHIVLHAGVRIDG